MKKYLLNNGSIEEREQPPVFHSMYKGSFYTKIGAGGDISEWIKGYAEMLGAEKIGIPVLWISFSGKEFNEKYGTKLPEDLTFLAFPLNGLDVRKLAIFKIKNEDKWFDDFVDNFTGGEK